MRRLRDAVLDIIQICLRGLPWPTEPRLIEVGKPGRDAPVLLTCNYAYTVRRVLQALRGQDAYLLVAPTHGINVWCAAAGGYFTAHQVISILRTCGIADRVDHRRLILPQLSATGVERKLVEERTGWHIVFGPVYARDLAAYLAFGRKSDAMRQVSFQLPSRMEMAAAWAFPISVIGAAILEVDRHNLVDLEPSEFADGKMGSIWEAIRAMPEVDAVALKAKFGESILTDLVSDVPVTARVADMAKKVREAAHRRNVAESLKKAYRMLESGASIADVGLFVNAQIDAVRPAKEATPIIDLMIDAYNQCKAATEDQFINFVPTGFIGFDRPYGGLPKDGLIIVAGRPSMGKSAFATAVARNVAKTKPVLLISMEMSGISLAMRLMASETNADLGNVSKGKLGVEEWRLLSTAVETLTQANLWINDMANRTVGDVCAEARRFKRQHGECGLVVIDYLTLMDLGKGDNQNDRIGKAMRALKVLSGEISCPIMVLSQLSRATEGRADKRPMMSDLRDSGNIEQDADVILFPYRDEVYHKKPENEGMADLIVAKYRNGPASNNHAVPLTWVAKSAKFADREIGGF